MRLSVLNSFCGNHIWLLQNNLRVGSEARGGGCVRRGDTQWCRTRRECASNRNMCPCALLRVVPCCVWGTHATKCTILQHATCACSDITRVLTLVRGVWCGASCCSVLPPPLRWPGNRLEQLFRQVSYCNIFSSCKRFSCQSEDKITIVDCLRILLLLLHYYCYNEKRIVWLIMELNGAQSLVE
jgi:hypothetical protein